MTPCNYHLPVKRAFSAASFETRIVHPFATKQFRQPADPGIKTDDNDLAAMHRATVSGFGLTEQPLDEVSQKLRLLTQHRRDLVEKRSAADDEGGRGKRKVMSLPADEFLARWLEHVPPPNLQTVRAYGLYAACKREELAMARQHLGQPPLPAEPKKMSWRG